MKELFVLALTCLPVVAISSDHLCQYTDGGPRLINLQSCSNAKLCRGEVQCGADIFILTCPALVGGTCPGIIECLKTTYPIRQTNHDKKRVCPEQYLGRTQLWSIPCPRPREDRNKFLARGWVDRYQTFVSVENLNMIQCKRPHSDAIMREETILNGFSLTEKDIPSTLKKIDAAITESKKLLNEKETRLGQLEKTIADEKRRKEQLDSRLSNDLYIRDQLTGLQGDVVFRIPKIYDSLSNFLVNQQQTFEILIYHKERRVAALEQELQTVDNEARKLAIQQEIASLRWEISQFTIMKPINDYANERYSSLSKREAFVKAIADMKRDGPGVVSNYALELAEALTSSRDGANAAITKIGEALKRSERNVVDTTSAINEIRSSIEGLERGKVTIDGEITGLKNEILENEKRLAELKRIETLLPMERAEIQKCINDVENYSCDRSVIRTAKDSIECP